MINLLAHVTPTEVPSAFLLLAVGFAAGMLVSMAWNHFRA